MEGFNNNSPLPIPTYKDVYNHLTQLDIYSRYVSDLVINGASPSPIGANDSHASFSVFWSHRKSKYIFKEHRYGYIGDAVDLVRYMFNYKDNYKACMKIMHDFGISGYYIDPAISLHRITSGIGTNEVIKIDKSERKVDIKVTIREWEDYDLEFWNSFGITKKWLLLAKIFPIKYYYINNNIRIADKLSYAYVETKDGVVSYKIYQPNAEFHKKWLSNNDSSVWELWELLPKKGNLLIITKSRKDALSIMSTMKIPATSLQAEGTMPKEHIVDELKSRFKYIMILYDNDFDKETNYGDNYGSRLAELFNLPQIRIPDEYREKDYSDLVKAYGSEKARSILLILIKKQLILNILT